MEVVALRYHALKRALITLDEGIVALEAVAVDDPKIQKLMRDGVIQRFEYCIDSFWKFMKMYLEIDRKISIEPPSPRSVLRLALSMHLVHDDEYDVLLSCVSDRNITSHTYNEETAESIQLNIPLYYRTMKGILERIKIHPSDQ